VLFFDSIDEDDEEEEVVEEVSAPFLVLSLHKSIQIFGGNHFLLLSEDNMKIINN
jgi:hypothetical protein